MSAARFEGSYGGDDSALADDALLECKICWTVYDPAEGDETRQIPPGTPFSALPGDWRCPVCDGDREQFMVLDPGAAAPAAPVADPNAERFAALPKLLERVFEEIHNGQLRGTPLVNASLSVQAVGFRTFEGGLIGVLISPWFMNLLVFPADTAELAAARTGEKRVLTFPSGGYEFVCNRRDETGPYLACSLFSPMSAFGSQLQAADTARAVMAAVFDDANRDETDRADEIRALREAELAAEAEAEAKAEAEMMPLGDAGPRTRRALFAGTRGTASESAAVEAGER